MAVSIEKVPYVTFDKIKEANDSIKTMAITRWDKKQGKEVSKDYAEVNQRIKAFRMVYPDGFITTDIVSIKDDVVFMKAEAGYYENGEKRVLGTGMAFESQESSLINKTSYIENCETSAVGRALGMCGFGIDMSVASYEEVKNAIAVQEANQKEAVVVAYTCAACGNTFTDSKLAEQTMKRYKKHICMDCINAKKKELADKKKADEEAKKAEQAKPIAPEMPDELPNNVQLPFEF